MIEFIASQLGIPISNARILYDQWLDTTMNMLSEGKPVTLGGLGTFTYNKKTLRFKPDAGLELDVNRAYAGLEPLPEEKLGPAKLTESDFDDPFMEIIAPKSYQPENVEEEPLDEPAASIHELPLTDEPNIKPWVVAALILAVVLIGGWYGVQWYGNTLESEMANSGVSKNVTATATAEEQQSELVTVEPTSPIATPEFGLRGAVNPLDGRVYAIIVHSLPTESQSQAECAKIVALGLRCSVVHAERNGVATFRVGIGQFESVEIANRSVGELPERYQTPGNFFITRIQ